jgi:DNA mismatch repair protein MutS
MPRGVSKGGDSKGAKLTPVMQQFADAKSEHPDAILFFRLGDFYEMFHDDAVLASQLLGITLTSRNKEDPKSEPMAGVPHHSAHNYIAKLLALGHKVALCEQLADPSKVKGIVPRAVVRVLTPGIVTAEEHLDARENLFLAAFEGTAEAAVGAAFLDFSTGELFVAELADRATCLAEVARQRPREVLLGPGMHALAEDPTLAFATARKEPAPVAAPLEILRALLGESAAGDAAGRFPERALAAAARVLSYANVCSPRAGVPVRRLSVLPSEGCLAIDETAQQHLELVRTFDGKREPTLLSVVDKTVTASGARLLRRRLLAPLGDVKGIRARLDEVESFVVHSGVRGEVRRLLEQVPDLERIVVRIAIGEAGPKDLGALRDALRLAPEIVAKVAGIPATFATPTELPHRAALAELFAELDRALVDAPPALAKDGGLVREGFDAALDRERARARSGTEEITRWEARLRAETGAQTLRIRYNSVFGWYVEVTKSQLAKVPASFRRKQTVAGGERYTTPELDQLAAEIERASELVKERELELLGALLASARRREEAVRDLAARLAAWDVAAALAELAHRADYVKPEIDDGGVLDVVGGRHPVVEAHVARGAFVPNDTSLDRTGGRLWLVTGPNMAGKSTLMRQVALIVVLAQMGSYVPAERARIGVCDRLLSRVGASDNLARGESTFMVEMRETASILRHATQRSLVILDEIGRGTSTYDGLAIAWAVAEYLHDVVGCRALFATHYHELTELSKTARHLRNVSVSAREHEGGIVFLHTLLAGPASKSYGIAVAKLAGLPREVLARAELLCEELEQGAASSRSRGGGRPKAQLGLFGDAPPSAGIPSGRRDESTPNAARPPTSGSPAAVAPTPPPSPLLETLAAVDVDRMTPVEALVLLAKLKALARG